MLNAASSARPCAYMHSTLFRKFKVLFYCFPFIGSRLKNSVFTAAFTAAYFKEGYNEKENSKAFCR